MDIDDNSNDVVAINSDDDDVIKTNNEKPILQLFKRLVFSDSKQHTVLTNAQIVDILSKEFDVNISDLHELEGDIYLTVIKKFLKEWPQWKQFDQIINDFETHNKPINIDNILETNSASLRSYLKLMLDSTQVAAKKTIEKIKENSKIKEKDANSDKTVVLEIQASRNQLNQLFYRKPNPDLNNTVFNATYSQPTQIQLTTLPLEAILNWWGVNISLLNVTNIRLYKREMKHELKHVLVNKTLMSRLNHLKVLDQDLKISNYQKVPKVDTSVFINLIDKMAAESGTNGAIYEFIKRDLKMLPDKIYPRATYKRYTNKYSYIRYLYKEVENSDVIFRNFDLHLEETLSPMYQTYLGQIHDSNKFLIVECEPCAVKFTGQHLVHELKAHFDEQHQNEPDWKCTNCNMKFPMATLAQNWWCHRC